MASMKKSPKKALKHPIEMASPVSGLRIVDDLTVLLERAASPLLSRAECQAILKNLMIFVSETPIAVTENLFSTDQVTGTNSFNLNSPDQLKHRNWQWVLQCNTDSEIGMIQQLAWGKSRAVMLGRLMTPQSSEHHRSHGVRLIIGFWLQKLYEIRNPTIQFYEIPECMRTAYYQFLKWQGYSWRNKEISGETVSQLISSLYDAHKIRNIDAITKQGIMNGFWRVKNLPMSIPAKAEDTFKGLGTKRLAILYLSQSFNGTLEEFRNNWEMESGEPAIVAR